jgi:hypothetical protein
VNIWDLVVGYPQFQGLKLFLASFTLSVYISTARFWFNGVNSTIKKPKTHFCLPVSNAMKFAAQNCTKLSVSAGYIVMSSIWIHIPLRGTKIYTSHINQDVTL